MDIRDINPHLRFATALHYEMCFNRKNVKVTDCRIFYVLEGTADLRIGQREYTLVPDSLFYCCAGSRYAVNTEHGFSLISLNFDLTQAHSDRLLPFSPSRDMEKWDAMPVYFDSVPGSGFLNDHLFLEKAGKLRSPMEQITADFASGDRYGRELSSAGLKWVLTVLHQHSLPQLPPKIAQVQQYIQQNYARDITNRELAQLAGYHEYYLNRLFTACMGVSLHGYLLKVRLSQASYLLLNTDMELQTICEQVGFSSYPHFSTYFKKAYGYAPAQYRKHLRGSI